MTCASYRFRNILQKSEWKCLHFVCCLDIFNLDPQDEPECEEKASVKKTTSVKSFSGNMKKQSGMISSGSNEFPISSSVVKPKIVTRGRSPKSMLSNLSGVKGN